MMRKPTKREIYLSNMLDDKNLSDDKRKEIISELKKIGEEERKKYFPFV